MAKKKKKSWKKKLLKAALIGGALYGGSKLLGKMRGKSVEDTAAHEDANIGVTHDALKPEYITEKAKVAPVDTGKDVFTPRVYPGTVLNERRKIPGYGTANYPGANPYRAPLNTMDPMRHQYGLKGGGIAKRGTGAAYKSGGRVKSMGIAKRGGGAAKR